MGIMMFLLCKIFSFLLIFYTPIKAVDVLDAALFESMIPLSSKKCAAMTKSTAFQTNYTFEYELSHSAWNTNVTNIEKELFLAQMSHINKENSNKSWSLRVGQGGNIYSFRGAYGEAVPPQNHPEAIFTDEVTQSVSVHMNVDPIPEAQYFIQQAGGADVLYHPNFSPSIAHHCQNRECKFASWGQKAYPGDEFESEVLFFNSYKDCGGGVIQFTSVIHNIASYDGTGDVVSYLNVPWSGVRQSTLRDVFTSNRDGKMNLDYPPKYFLGQDSMLNPSETGGYTTFTEEVLVPEQTFNKYPFQLPEHMRIKIASNDGGHFSQSNSQLWQRYCMFVYIEATEEQKSGCVDCDLLFTNKKTGDSIRVRLVLHWAWGGDKLYFCPENIQAEKFNSVFKKHDEIIISRRNVGKPMENNLALTFIHGFQSNLKERRAPSRIRWGKCGNLIRDFTVFTCNTRVTVYPGDTYFYQQYISTGQLIDAEATALSWVDEVHEDFFHSGELKGREITLYSVDDKTFGAHVEGQMSCLRGEVRCVGKTAPDSGLRALFAINCGEKAYLGFNKLYFSPSDNHLNRSLSFQCKGESTGTRPRWKLIGFFSEGTCDYLSGAAYHSNFCSKDIGEIA